MNILGMNIWGMIIGAFIVLLFASLIRAHYNKELSISLFDLVTRDGKLSTTMILQLVGGVVGTWVMVKTTIAGTLSWDMFLAYLGYVASVDGFSKVVAAKYSQSQGYGGYGGYGGYRRGAGSPSEEVDGLPTTARKTEPIE